MAFCSVECREAYRAGRPSPRRILAAIGFFMAFAGAAGLVGVAAVSLHGQEMVVLDGFGPYRQVHLPRPVQKKDGFDRESFLKERIAKARQAILSVTEETSLLVEALGVLCEQKDGSARARLRAIMNRDGPLALEAGVQLARAGFDEGVAYLRARLRRPGDYRNPEAALALARLGDRSVAHHIEVLLGFRQTRWMAAEAGTILGVARARELLLRRMESAPRLGDRIRAAAVLAELRDPRARPVLLRGLDTGTLRFTAAMGLSWFGYQGARPVLEEALLHPPVRIKAARALMRIIEQAPLYRPLFRDLDSPLAPERISAAGAVMVLYGGRDGR